MWVLLSLDFGEEHTICSATERCNCSMLSRTPIEKLKLEYIVIPIAAILFPLSAFENSM